MRRQASTISGPRALGRISHSMTYHGLSPRVWAASTYSRVLMSIVRLRTMRKMPGPEARATAMKMLSVLGLTRRMPNGSALKTKVANSHAPGDESQPESRGELRRLRAVARDEQHAEEDDRHGEED